jgi:hypothetical protein
MAKGSLDTCLLISGFDHTGVLCHGCLLTCMVGMSCTNARAIVAESVVPALKMTTRSVRLAGAC